MTFSFRNHRLLCFLLIGLLACFGALAEETDVSGCAYVDDNQNNLCDTGEQLMTGVPVTLQRLDGETWVAVDQAVTDAYGKYAFSLQGEGNYRVVCTLSGQDLYAAAVGSTAQLSDNCAYGEAFSAPVQGMDVALRKAARLSVSAFHDGNRDGERRKNERNVAGVTFSVMDGDTALFSAQTDARGETGLSVQPGEYTLRVTLPENYAFTTYGADATGSCVGDTDQGEAYSMPLTFVAGQETAVSAGVLSVGSMSGRAFEDMNNNGLMDTDEPGVEGVAVHIVGKRTGTDRTFITAADGLYLFDRLPDDSYSITAELPQGMLFARYSTTGGKLRSIFTGSALERQFSVKKAAQLTDLNIGVVQKGVIHGKVFLDLNYNGIMDEGEPGCKGVTLEAIKLSNSESMGRFTTGEDGAFRLENLRGGDYRLRAILPDDGTVFSVTAQGNVDEVNRFEQRLSRRESSVQPISIVSGGEASVLVGVARGATITGTVFQDANYNGSLDKKEKTFSGVKVYAVDAAGTVVASDTTGPKGQYTLKGIMPGSYTVEVQRKAGYGFTRLRPTQKGGSHVKELIGDRGVTESFDISMDQILTDVNAGMLPASTVSGMLFHDANDDGLRSEGEIGMVSAKVRLLSSDGEIDLTHPVSDDGSYFFDGVMPGKYTLTYLLPEHCEMARVAEGGNTIQHVGAETTTAPFEVAMGKTHVLPMAGAVTLGNFSGYVFHDSNANGILDSGEERLAGAVLTLTPARAGLEAGQAKSAADGSFAVEGLRPSEYTLTVALPDGFISSHVLSGAALDARQEQTLAIDWAYLIDRSEKAIGAVKPAAIRGTIRLDENKNGTQEPDETILSNVTLELVDEASDKVVQTVRSAETGFTFENVRPGTYAVRFLLPEQSSTANDSASTFVARGNAMVQNGITVCEGQLLSTLTTSLISRTSIGGKAWLEESGARVPVTGLAVRLSMDGKVLQTTVTDENGAYRFDGLWPAEYTLEADLPGGMVFVRPNDPNYPAGTSVITRTAEGRSDAIALRMARHQLECNILFIKPAKVGDIAWLDENRNGLVDGNEPMIPGVKVMLVQNGAVAYETATNAYGYYLFNDVYPGEYTLRAAAYPELSPTGQVPELRMISTCLTKGDGLQAESDPFRVQSGTTNPNYDLGYVLRDGQPLPAAIAAPESRNWTLPNQPRVFK